MLTQGQEARVPAEIIASETNSSWPVQNLTVDSNEYSSSASTGSRPLPHLFVEKLQPLLFNIKIPASTELGTYNIPMVVTIRDTSTLPESIRVLFRNSYNVTAQTMVEASC